jgi:outer membrane receptor protein involved in Fe transport
VPLNPFGPTTLTAAALNYVTERTVWLNALNNIAEVAGHIGGDLFNDWAGPVKADLSAEYRDLSEQYVSQGSNQTVDCTGLRQPCGGGTAAQGAGLYQYFIGTFPKATQSVKEAALEVEVPLLKDLPLAKQVDLNAAGRRTAYSIAGDYSTYKAGLNWKVNDSVTLRAMTSKDIRAPSVYELFQPIAQNVPTTCQTDYLTGNCLGGLYVQTGGNPNLSAEIGRTKTLGIVLRPEFVPGFSLALDYFHTIISNALIMGALNGTDQSTQEACYASGGTSSLNNPANSPFCPLIIRDAAGNLLGFSSQTLNVSSINTWGEDLEINYARQMFNRPFAFRLFIEQQPHNYTDIPGTPTTDSAGAAAPAGSPGEPATRILASVNFDLFPSWSVNLDERWRSSLNPSSDPTQFYNIRVASVGYTDIDLSHKMQAFRSDLQVFLHVQNLFDKMPPVFANNNTAYSFGDDPVGRYVTIGVRGKF